MLQTLIPSGAFIAGFCIRGEQELISCSKGENSLHTLCRAQCLIVVDQNSERFCRLPRLGRVHDGFRCHFVVVVNNFYKVENSLWTRCMCIGLGCGVINRMANPIQVEHTPNSKFFCHEIEARLGPAAAV
jgi:hypothetical protein